MESVEAEIRYVIYTKVNKVFEEKGQWYVHFEGSWESLGFGWTKPPFDAGDRIKITFERMPSEKEKASQDGKSCSINP